MSLGPDDLVFCAGTAARAGFVERCRAAAEAGFRGVSLFLDDVARARAGGLSDADLRAVLADCGLEVAELDPLLSWASEPPAERGKGFMHWREADFYAVAETLGARSLNAVLFDPRPIPRDALVESFAALCDRAAERGLLVHLEFMPFSGVRDVDAAMAIVAGADRPNGGIMFDTWHHFRGGLPNLALCAAAPRITAIQLDDAPREPVASILEETLHHRLMPGDGDIELVQILRLLREGGCTAPLGIEVFCDDLAGLSTAELAKRSAESLRALLDEVARA